MRREGRVELSGPIKGRVSRQSRHCFLSCQAFSFPQQDSGPKLELENFAAQASVAQTVARAPELSTRLAEAYPYAYKLRMLEVRFCPRTGELGNLSQINGKFEHYAPHTTYASNVVCVAKTCRCSLHQLEDIKM
jgi:hypothetical protein